MKENGKELNIEGDLQMALNFSVRQEVRSSEVKGRENPAVSSRNMKNILNNQCRDSLVNESPRDQIKGVQSSNNNQARLGSMTFFTN